MPTGREFGSYSLKSTPINKSVDAAGNRVFVLSMEGTLSGGWNGTVLSSITTTASDFEAGTYISKVSVYLADGSVVIGAGFGVLKSANGHNWQPNGTDVVSNGMVIASEGTRTL